MNEQIKLQLKLNEVFSGLKIKNPQYSLRAFAKKLDLAPSTLSEILNGKKRASVKLARKISDRLLLDPQERSEILDLYSERFLLGMNSVGESQKIDRDKEKEYVMMSADQFKIISDWQHYALLNLIKTVDFSSSEAWIASRLDISEKSVSEVIERLIRAGMLERLSDGALRRTQNKTRTTDDVINLSIQKAHAEELEIAKEKLESVPLEMRDFTSVTLAINPDKIPMAKELIRKFQDDLCDVLGAGDKKEVYKICFQLFPLTEINMRNLKN